MNLSGNSGIPSSMQGPVNGTQFGPDSEFHQLEPHDSDSEIGTNDERFTKCEDDDVISKIDYPISVNLEHVTPETDNDRPHGKKDDSNTSVNGASQLTTKQLCAIKSVTWAAEIVGIQFDNPNHERITVSNPHSKKHL